MQRNVASSPKVAMIEPVGGHGGMDYYDFGFCEGLSRAGVQVALYTCDETPLKIPAAYKVNFSYRQIYGNDPAWLRGVRYVRGSIRALLGARLSRAQIAHFHFFHVGPLELFNVLLAKLLGLKVVVTAHDVQSFVQRLSVAWMVRKAYEVSDRVIVQSKIGERELKAVLPGSEAKVDTIPHGNYLHCIEKTPTRAKGRARLGLPDRVPVLLFFGHIKKVKGLDVLLQAMPKLVREWPDALLLVAGKVWKDDLRYYKDQIDALGVSDNCVLHIRHIPNAEVPNYYAAADVVVLPYRRIYQSGVLLMAMSYGKPVVVSDIEGMTEVVSDGINGYVFPSGDPDALADKLIGAVSDSEDVRRVGERALLHIREHHDWSKIGQMTAACYRAVLKGS